MATPKQKENEEKFLDPLLADLKPTYSDITADVMRGKKRGDGIMVDPEAHEDREDILHEVDNAMDDVKRDWKSEIREDVLKRKGVYEESDFVEGRPKAIHELNDEGKITDNQASQLRQEIREETEKRQDDLGDRKERKLQELPYSKEQVEELANRWYVAEYVNYMERESWIPAKLSFGVGKKYTSIDHDMLKALGSVIYTVQRKKDPEWRPDRQADEPSTLAKMYGDSKEKAQERANRRVSLFE